MSRSQDSILLTQRSRGMTTWVLPTVLLLAGGCVGDAPAESGNAQCRLLTATKRHEPDDTVYRSDTFTWDDAGDLRTWLSDGPGWTSGNIPYRAFLATYTYAELPEVHRRVAEVEMVLDGGSEDRFACLYASAHLPAQLSRGLEGDITSGLCVDEGADGLLVRDYETADAEWDRRDLYSYDAFGNPKFEDVDEGIDGTIDHRGSHSYTYDANGRVLRDDFIDDQYDADHNYEDSVRAFTYDADGRVLTASLDYNHDRDVDEIRSYTYDPDGRLLNEDVDTGPNTATNDRVTYVYGEDGWLQTVFLYSGLPSNNPGLERMSFTHDEHGNVVVVVVDGGSDDLSNLQYRWTDRYTYDC